MWKQPWSYKEGFAISIGLVFVGLLLQFSVGAISTQFLQYPTNLVVGIIYIMLVIALSVWSKKNKTLHWFSRMEASISSMTIFLLLVVIMGLTRQEVTPDRSGLLGILGFKNMLSSWSFIFMFVYMNTVLGLVTMRRLRHFRLKKDLPFFLNHFGLFMTLTAAVLGSADMHRYQMVVEKGSTEWRVTNEEGKMLEMDLAVELHNFTIEEYPPKLMIIDNETGKTLPENQPENLLVESAPVKGQIMGYKIEVLQLIEEAAPVLGAENMKFVAYHSEGATAAVLVKVTDSKKGNTIEGWVSGGSYLFPYRALPINDQVSLVMPDREPKRFASDVTIYTKDGQNIKSIIEVNKPQKVNGWKIYQISYDEQKGKWSNISKFELIKDPWIIWVYAGIILMISGALTLFIVGKPAAKDDEKNISTT